jgi:hypothetical protein
MKSRTSLIVLLLHFSYSAGYGFLLPGMVEPINTFLKRFSGLSETIVKKSL